MPTGAQFRELNICLKLLKISMKTNAESNRKVEFQIMTDKSVSYLEVIELPNFFLDHGMSQMFHILSESLNLFH